VSLEGDDKIGSGRGRKRPSTYQQWCVIDL
jgi:hypothetical protein